MKRSCLENRVESHMHEETLMASKQNAVQNARKLSHVKDIAKNDTRSSFPEWGIRYSGL